MSNKTAKHIMSTNFSVGSMIWNGIIATIVINVLLGIVVALCWVTIILIPLGILFGFLAVANTVSAVFSIIGMFRCKGHLTEEGIYGKKSIFGSFDVTFDQVAMIIRKKKIITIVALDANGKKKKYNLTAVKNAKDFEQACLKAKAAYRAPEAETAAEAPAAE